MPKLQVFSHWEARPLEGNSPDPRLPQRAAAIDVLGKEIVGYEPTVSIYSMDPRRERETSYARMRAVDQKAIDAGIAYQTEKHGVWYHQMHPQEVFRLGYLLAQQEVLANPIGWVTQGVAADLLKTITTNADSLTCRIFGGPLHPKTNRTKNYIPLYAPIANEPKSDEA